MKKALLMAMCGGLLLGCDYKVSLVETASEPIDPAVVGAWERTSEGGSVERLLILPISEQEYLVVFPEGASNALYARGHLWRHKDITLVQLDWFGTSRVDLPQDDRTFQYVSFSVDADTLTCRLLNPEVVDKDIRSSAALVEAIMENNDHPELYRPSMVFQKVD